MFTQLTRGRVIALWFVIVGAIAITGYEAGIKMALSTGVLLLAASVVPPVILMAFWPAAPTATASELMHDGNTPSGTP
jgi:hypothetical protein